MQDCCRLVEDPCSSQALGVLAASGCLTAHCVSGHTQYWQQLPYSHQAELALCLLCCSGPPSTMQAGWLHTCTD